MSHLYSTIFRHFVQSKIRYRYLGNLYIESPFINSLIPALLRMESFHPPNAQTP